MNIDKYKNEDGSYTYKECHHDDAVSVIGEMLGFCGCGSNESAMEFVRDALQLVKERHLSSHEEAWKIILEKQNTLFHNDNIMFFTWYWLDDKGLTEHGSSVPGWLTNKGKEILDDLNEILKEDDTTLVTPPC